MVDCAVLRFQHKYHVLRKTGCCAKKIILDWLGTYYFYAFLITAQKSVLNMYDTSSWSNVLYNTLSSPRVE